VHTFDTKPAVWGRLAAWFARVPVVIGTIPGLGSLYSQNDSRTRAIRSIYQPLQKLACSISDLTIFQNQEDAEQFIQEGIVLQSKTAIINGSGVQTEIYDPQEFKVEQQRQVRGGLGLDETKIVITMISRLIRSKGVLEFAQAAKSTREQHPDTVFLLVGASDYQSVDVLTLDEQDLIRKSVTCLGERKDVPELLAISDIFVLPTYYREGIPRVLLEAASMGLPIVATNVPGCTEVVEQDANGFLVPARDVDTLRNAIETLVVDPSLRKRFGIASRQRAITRFDLSIIAGQTSEIYKQLLAEKLHGRKTNS
jgi:glycosyltransferase involved in cell wall biosynthesis